MTARVGAVHLGWDVVSVAAGGGGTPIRPVQVEGTYTPPAYLLADSSGRLHTAGVDRRPDVGIAISDVRDIIGHPQIVVAGATWPAELVFRARMHNPLASVVDHLGGAQPDVLALPFPDEWPDPKVDEFVRLVEQLGVPAEPLPESVALSGYVRALGLVRAPGRGPGVGAVGVYSDGRECLVVAVHGNDDQPTESVSVAITAEALHEAHAADNVVIEVMAAARAINADTSTVLLTGNVCFNDALRLAFQNHLGHRFQVADHPMHALVLGATHLLVADSEGDPAYDRPQQASGAAQPSAGGVDSRPVEQGPRHVTGGPAAGQPLARQPEPLAQQPELIPRHMDSPPTPESATQRPGSARGTGPQPAIDPTAAASAGDDSAGRTRRLTADEAAAIAAAAQGSRSVGTGPQPAVDPAVEGITRRITPQESASQGGQGGAVSPTGSGGLTQRTTAEQAAHLTAQAGAAGHVRHEAPAAVQPPSDDAGQRVPRGTEGPASGSQPVAGGRGTLPPGLEGVGGRFMRPPGSPADDQMTAVMGRGEQSGAVSGQSGTPAEAGYGSGSAGAQQGSGGAPAGAYGSGGYGQSGGHGQAAGQPGYGQPGGQQSSTYGPGGSYPSGQSGAGAGSSGYQGGVGYSPANPRGSDAGAQGGYGPGGAQPGGGGQYGAAPGVGGQYGHGGYGSAGYGQQSGYGQAGYSSGPYGPEGDPSDSGRGNFAGSGGNAPGQPGAMYGGPMSTGARGANPQTPEDAAGQSDSDSGSEGERKQRKGKLWNKMRKPFGAPIIVGAAALSLMGGNSDQQAEPVASSLSSDTVIQVGGGGLLPVDESCAVTPFVSGLPHPGIANIGDPQSSDCLRFGIDTLRYTIPGPARGVDPGPPLHI
ncbi:hypothetical protein [Nocardia aurantiaca]|uniref:hypothetical protein n=1 Tax=Nocardia aurantiaca TaxID=2675850 RepID=UPI001E54A63B|nr:hypothetical protein [Nocardia aurantiaca]